MKKRIIALLSAVALAGITLAGVVSPAVATGSVPAAVQTETTGPGQCYTGNNFPTEINGCRFWKGSTICVDGSGIESSAYRVSFVAQSWNLAVATPHLLSLDYSSDCVADGYTPSLRMVIGGYHGGATGACLYHLNQGLSLYNGMARWTSGPGVYINQDRSACVGTQTRRDHVISMAIGSRLGLSYLATPGWSGRVMYGPSYDLVALPTGADAIGIRQIYSQYFGG